MLAMDKGNVSFDISPLHLLDSQTLPCLGSYSVGGWIFSTELSLSFAQNWVTSHSLAVAFILQKSRNKYAD